ncbi:MAG: MBL fold metallo-hydrolase [Chloroflexi bacterium]|nr:MBL fold metallo-hydrolase [Chloroflexota bacterium]MCI0645712.1 MBL fold metallo-hydrolase [Chloroflexota bacterium]MCI0731243.1 MBL fold metallo-hydrolase [Chloroflexota bacterium]
MLLRYFYDQKLAQASYFVGCQETGEAIVVDPARDVEPYLEAAEAEGMRIIGAAETHIHADFVSGARELAERTGATLYLSDAGDPAWKYRYTGQYRHVPLHDEDLFMVGNLRFEALHTPGHTPEHIALLVTDTAGADRPMGLFSGDFVFVGDVGRPDLLEKAARVANTAEKGARQMFHSLQRFKELPDYLQLWPGHGAGSACGKALGAVPSSTVGYEKMFNWALSQTSEEAFVRELLAGQPEPPRYFAMMKRVNQEGPPVLHRLPLPEHLPFNRLASALQEKVMIVDSRRRGDFAAGHIPGTINIPHNNSFINWAGWLVDYDRPFYLIASHQNAAQVARDLAAIGLDNVAGYFDVPAVESWAENGYPVQSYDVITPPEIGDRALRGEVTFVDVRNQSEWDEGHIPGARHIMLGYLNSQVGEIPTDKPVVVVCQSGNRSAIGASILQARGILAVANLMGGMRDWKAAGLPMS